MNMIGTWLSALFRFSRRQSLETVGAGHDRIHENDVGNDFFDDRKRMFAFARNQHRHAGLFERVGQ